MKKCYAGEQNENSVEKNIPKGKVTVEGKQERGHCKSSLI